MRLTDVRLRAIIREEIMREFGPAYPSPDPTPDRNVYAYQTEIDDMDLFPEDIVKVQVRFVVTGDSASKGAYRSIHILEVTTEDGEDPRLPPQYIQQITKEIEGMDSYRFQDKTWKIED